MDIITIKTQLPILTVLQHYGLQPDKNKRLCCPFHEDKTPSLQIYPQTNTYCCFSSNCTAGTGDQIEFIERMDKQGKHQALVKAQSLIPSVASPVASPTKGDTLTRVFTYFRTAVSRSEPAKAYAEGRGLDMSVIEMGFNSGQFHHRENSYLIDSGVQLGLLKVDPSGGYQVWAKHCLIFPLRNAAHQIVSLYGRSLTETKDNRHFYLKGRQGLYPGYPKTETTQLILTESVIDAATLLLIPTIAPHYTVLALYGTNGFTAEHGQALKGLPALEEVILWMDGDQAGKEAVYKHTEGLLSLLPQVTITWVETPEGEDINSLAQSHEPEVFTHLLESRKPTISSPAVTTPHPPEIPVVEKPLPKTNPLQVISPELLIYHHSPLQITLLGGVKLTGLDKLRVTLKVEHQEKAQLLPVRHNLDLYHAQQTELLIQKIAENLQVNPSQTARTFEQLTTALEDYRSRRLEALRPKPEVKPTLTDRQQQAAIQYLTSPQLMERTQADIGHSGLIGEEANRLIAFLVYTSRKRENPLQLMCLGASGTGKTYLQEKIGELMPEEDKLEITTLSENAFYYFGQEDLKHKLILIEDLDGAQDVLYPLRELQSKKRISKTVVLKDSKGNLKTVTLKVEGPVCVSGCTTREKLYEDNANRCILLEIDTSKSQDAAIMDYQRQVSAGTIHRQKEQQAKALLQDGQRVLKPILIRNPYAPLITLPESVFKPRRTISLLLGFIETITFYHQYQCAVKKDPVTGENYIQTTPEHIQWAFTLLQEVLFRKSDELSGATRRFLETLKTHLQAENRPSFQAKEVRAHLRLNPNNLKRYLMELERYGYLQGKGNRYKGYEYHITNTAEYETLKSGIQADLQAILQRIQ